MDVVMARAYDRADGDECAFCTQFAFRIDVLHTEQMTSLADLLRVAGAALRPAARFDAGRTITGVHVSELAEPARYLDGGELLLTTGIPLTGGASDADYVERLAEGGVGALGLGLGEGWDAPPSGFVETCLAHDLPLLLVPDGVPFLHVSRAFGEVSGRDERDAMMRTAHAHTRVVQAASDPAPVVGVIRQVAQAIGGWAAWIPFDERAPVGALHPPSLAGMLPAIAADVEHSLQRSGVAAASFVAHGSAVVAHTVAARGRTVGALALGAGRPLSQSDRQLSLTAITVLSLVAAPFQSAGPSAMDWVSALALDGDADAARAVARLAGEPIPEVLRVVLTPGGRAEEPLGSRLFGDALVRVVDDSYRSGPSPGAMSAPVPLEDVPAAAARLHAQWLAGGQDRFIVEPLDRASAWVRELTANPPLDETVRAHLASAHRIERTARALGVHRNTVRQRIAAAEALLGLRLDDPDVTAELWFALRARRSDQPAR